MKAADDRSNRLEIKRHSVTGDASLYRVPCWQGRGGFMDSAGLIAIGAGLAVGLAAIGTGLAQGRIGSAGVGAVAEKREMLGPVILLVAIPETMVILGFVIAVMIQRESGGNLSEVLANISDIMRDHALMFVGVVVGLTGFAPTDDGVMIIVAVGFGNACCAVALSPRSRAKS